MTQRILRETPNGSRLVQDDIGASMERAMTDTPTLSSRLREAQGADDMLDSEIMIHFYDRKRDGKYPPFLVPKYTSDLNAVFALVTRKFPYASYRLEGPFEEGERPNSTYCHAAELYWAGGGGTSFRCREKASDLCRALLLALLQAEEANHG